MESTEQPIEGGMHPDKKEGGFIRAFCYAKLKRRVNLVVDGRVHGLPQTWLFDVHLLYFDILIL